jgi:hypothetical protein
MSYSGHLVESYLARTGQPRDGQRDAQYAYQWTVLRDMLARLEVILDDEDVPRETAERVMRCLLYGAPSAADAEQRMERDREMIDLMARVPPMPVHFSGAADLGMPPR